MIEILAYTVTAILLYLFSDWILVRIEMYKGKTLPNRSLIFFAIIFVLALASFEVLQRLLNG